MKYCQNCGKPINGNFCQNCGNQANGSPKSGKAVASLVLGIIAVIWALMEIASFEDVGKIIEERSFAYLFGAFIGLNILSLPCGLTGLLLGLKSTKDGKGKAGLIMSIIALAVSLVSIFVIIANI